MTDERHGLLPKSRDIANVILEPLVVYARGLACLWQRDFFLSNSPSARSTTEFMLGAVAVGSILGSLWPSPRYTFSTIGFLDDLVAMGLWFVVSLPIAGIAHWVLKRRGGSASFGMTLVPYLYGSGATNPIMIIAAGFPNYGPALYLPLAIALMYWYARALSTLHGVPSRVSRNAVGAGIFGLAIPFGIFGAWLGVNQGSGDVQAIERRRALANDAQETRLLERYQAILIDFDSGNVSAAESVRSIEREVIEPWGRLVDSLREEMSASEFAMTPVQKARLRIFETRDAAFRKMREALLRASESTPDAITIQSLLQESKALWDEANIRAATLIELTAK